MILSVSLIFWILYQLTLINTANAFIHRRSSCPSLDLPNGRIRFRSSGRIARFNCFKPYTLVGDNVATCVHGQWNAPKPFCAKTGCQKLDKLRNGELISNYRGAVVKPICDSGFSLVGSPLLYCRGPSWNDTLPVCQAQTFDQFKICNFEPDETEQCSWINQPSVFIWRIYPQSPSSLSSVLSKGAASRKNATSPNTRPSFDHTLAPHEGGHYLYLESNYATTVSLIRHVNLHGGVAKYTSPLLPSILDNVVRPCLIFWYYMYGPHVGTLRVNIGNDTVWEKSGNQGNRWQKALIKFQQQPKAFHVVIEGTGFLGHYSNTAIDDIKISVGSECDAPATEVLAYPVEPEIPEYEATKQTTIKNRTLNKTQDYNDDGDYSSSSSSVSWPDLVSSSSSSETAAITTRTDDIVSAAIEVKKLVNDYDSRNFFSTIYNNSRPLVVTVAANNYFPVVSKISTNAQFHNNSSDDSKTTTEFIGGQQYDVSTETSAIASELLPPPVTIATTTSGFYNTTSMLNGPPSKFDNGGQNNTDVDFYTVTLLPELNPIGAEEDLPSHKNDHDVNNANINKGVSDDVSRFNDKQRSTAAAVVVISSDIISFSTSSSSVPSSSSTTTTTLPLAGSKLEVEKSGGKTIDEQQHGVGGGVVGVVDKTESLQQEKFLKINDTTKIIVKQDDNSVTETTTENGYRTTVVNLTDEIDKISSSSSSYTTIKDNFSKTVESSSSLSPLHEKKTKLVNDANDEDNQASSLKNDIPYQEQIINGSVSSTSTTTTTTTTVSSDVTDGIISSVGESDHQVSPEGMYSVSSLPSTNYQRNSNTTIASIIRTDIDNDGGDDDDDDRLYSLSWSSSEEESVTKSSFNERRLSSNNDNETVPNRSANNEELPNDIGKRNATLSSVINEADTTTTTTTTTNTAIAIGRKNNQNEYRNATNDFIIPISVAFKDGGDNNDMMKTTVFQMSTKVASKTNRKKKMQNWQKLQQKLKSHGEHYHVKEHQFLSLPPVNNNKSIITNKNNNNNKENISSTNKSRNNKFNLEEPDNALDEKKASSSAFPMTEDNNYTKRDRYENNVADNIKNYCTLAGALVSVVILLILVLKWRRCLKTDKKQNGHQLMISSGGDSDGLELETVKTKTGLFK